LLDADPAIGLTEQIVALIATFMRDKELTGSFPNPHLPTPARS